MNWRALIFFAITFALPWQGYSQYTSYQGQFEVDQVKGCAPLTVAITVIPPFFCDSSNPCAAFFENSTTSVPLITPPFTHTYAQPGVYMMKILMGTQMDSIRIEVTDNVEPEFRVYTCGNNEVSVQLDDSNYDEYIVNFNDGNPEVVVGGTGATNHVFGSGVTQTISVRGHDVGADDNCSAGATTVTPLLTLPAPTITRLEVLDEGRIRLEFDAQPNIQYKLGIATNSSTAFQQAATLYNTLVDTVYNLKTDDNYYCFQLAAFDPCNNTVMNSATICSANFDALARNNAVDITWTTPTAGIANYSLARTASDGTTLTTTPGGSPYADLGVVCGTEYCYQLTSTYTNGSTSVSQIKCDTGISTDIPTAITNITAVVNDTGVELDWLVDPDFPAAEFTIEKSLAGNYSVLSTTPQNSFTDAAYKTEDNSCYRIHYQDLCGNASPAGREACPIRLTADLRPDNAVVLAWTPYEGWANGVASYTIEKYSQDGVLLQSFDAGTSASYTDTSTDPNHQGFVYIIIANPTDAGLGQSISNRVPILKDPNLFHPTAFTPNGDNLNDIFTVFGQYVVDFEMKIFNRWGELLFTTGDIQSGWDGTYRGHEMPEGTYTFIANITDLAGRRFKRSGTVLLLRRE